MIGGMTAKLYQPSASRFTIRIKGFQPAIVLYFTWLALLILLTFIVCGFSLSNSVYLSIYLITKLSCCTCLESTLQSSSCAFPVSSGNFHLVSSCANEILANTALYTKRASIGKSESSYHKLFIDPSSIIRY